MGWLNRIKDSLLSKIRKKIPYIVKYEVKTEMRHWDSKAFEGMKEDEAEEEEEGLREIPMPDDNDEAETSLEKVEGGEEDRFLKFTDYSSSNHKRILELMNGDDCQEFYIHENDLIRCY